MCIPFFLRGFAFLEFCDSGVVDKVTSKEHTIDGKVVEVKKSISQQVNLFVCLFLYRERTGEKGRANSLSKTKHSCGCCLIS